MKKIVIITIVICLLVLGVFIYWFFLPKEIEHEIVEETNGYVLLSNASDYEKELFGSLNEEMDQEEKAKLIFQLFLANFYSLELANSKNDIRGVQFVYEPFQEDFIKLAKEQIYFAVPNNYFNKRSQKLPMIKEVKVEEIIESEFVMTENTFSSYIVRGELIYENFPGFREEIELEIIVNSEKLEVVKMTSFLSNM